MAPPPTPVLRSLSAFLTTKLYRPDIGLPDSRGGGIYLRWLM